MFNNSQLRYQLLEDDDDDINNKKQQLNQFQASTAEAAASTTINNDNSTTTINFPLLEQLITRSTPTSYHQDELNNNIENNNNNVKSNSLSVVEFYRNKTIFITGATGFIGKVLLEKLLRMGIVNKIYILLRSKRGKSPQERLNELLTKSPIFSFYPLDLSKICAIDGDITKPNLGLKENDKLKLEREVNIIFHSAASVQFKGKLKLFIEQNVIGTDRVMKLASNMLSLKAVVYVSTAYANCNLHNIDEKVYSLEDYIQNIYLGNIDDYIEHIITNYGNQQLQPGHPILCGRLNCYTFSKALAEWLLIKKYSKILPLTICRPSIVTHSAQEPAVGWCDTKNGVSGAMILGGLGIARTMILNLKCVADVVPVDYVVNCMIVMAAHVAILPPLERKLVAHITTGERNPLTWGQLLDYSKLSVSTKPFLKQIRPLAKRPVATDTFMGRMEHQLTKIFSHYCFAIAADSLILLFGYRPFLLHITKRMHLGFDTLQPFTSRQWHFTEENYREIYQKLSPREQELFKSDIGDINWSTYIDDATLGTRRYLLKEDDSTIEKAVKRQKFLNWAYGSVEALVYLGIFATVWWNIFYVFD